jgi:hypothetical protein
MIALSIVFDRIGLNYDYKLIFLENEIIKVVFIKL